MFVLKLSGIKNQVNFWYRFRVKQDIKSKKFYPPRLKFLVLNIKFK